MGPPALYGEYVRYGIHVADRSAERRGSFVRSIVDELPRGELVFGC